MEISCQISVFPANNVSTFTGKISSRWRNYLITQWIKIILLYTYYTLLSNNIINYIESWSFMQIVPKFEYIWTLRLFADYCVINMLMKTNFLLENSISPFLFKVQFRDAIKINFPHRSGTCPDINDITFCNDCFCTFKNYIFVWNSR